MCSIVAATLDEFFMIRVAGLEGQIAAGLAVRSADGRTPAVGLAEIRERVIALQARQVELWQDVLVPALRAEGIEICTFESCTAAEQSAVGEWFDRNVYPGADAACGRARAAVPLHLRALAEPRRSSRAIPMTGEERFARVKVPEGLARFVAGR